MNATPIPTQNLNLVPQTREGVRAQIEHLEPHEMAEVSPAWLALVDSSGPIDPWIHGFVMVRRIDSNTVGQCGFKGPPGDEGVVEIAYGVAPEHEGNGYATEAATALVSYAFSSGVVRVVRAHTLPQSNASGRVLTKCGFRFIGEVIEPDDGLVWRWETRCR
jgi:ribosomal-protein-alanine N-acetyltransferase